MMTSGAEEWPAGKRCAGIFITMFYVLLSNITTVV